MGVMKTGNIVNTVEIEPTSHAFHPSVLTTKLPRLPDATTIPTPACLGRHLPERSVQTTTLYMLWIRYTWEILCLEQDPSNPYLLHSRLMY